MTSRPVASPVAATAIRSRIADGALLVACLGVAGALSILKRQDANWDLQNYHHYIGWAWWHGRRAYTHDLAAAQLQTYHNPLLDLPFFLMVDAGWDPRAIAAALAVPAGIAAYFAIKMIPLLFADWPPAERRLASLCALVIGLTGAMGRGVLGTTMNEWPGTALTLAALWLLVRALARAPSAALPRAALVGAGLLCGLATGAKLTYGVFAVGLCAALLLRLPPARLYRGGVEAAQFGVAVLAGTVISAGPWMWALWTDLQNPIFPYANAWFNSPWTHAREALGRAYGPHDIAEWLAFPFRLLAPRPFYVAEVKYVDARLPVLYALVLFAVAAWAVRGRTRAASGGAERRRVLYVFWAVSFVLWTAQSSIYRYIVPLEVLSGALVVALARHLLRPKAASVAFVVLAVLLAATTRPADWWRVEFGPRWFDVRMPPVERQALVLITSDAPLAYVLPHFPPDARHLGVNNNFSRPDLDTLMQATIARTIREHAGPIYALTHPSGNGFEVLSGYGLSVMTERCANIVANMTYSPVTLCPLARTRAP